MYETGVSHYVDEAVCFLYEAGVSHYIDEDGVSEVRFSRLLKYCETESRNLRCRWQAYLKPCIAVG